MPSRTGSGPLLACRGSAVSQGTLQHSRIRHNWSSTSGSHKTNTWICTLTLGAAAQITKSSRLLALWLQEAAWTLLPPCHSSGKQSQPGEVAPGNTCRIRMRVAIAASQQPSQQMMSECMALGKRHTIYFMFIVILFCWFRWQSHLFREGWRVIAMIIINNKTIGRHCGL